MLRFVIEREMPVQATSEAELQGAPSGSVMTDRQPVGDGA